MRECIYILYKKAMNLISKTTLQSELKKERKIYARTVIKLREHRRKIKIIKNILKKKRSKQ